MSGGLVRARSWVHSFDRPSGSGGLDLQTAPFAASLLPRPSDDGPLDSLDPSPGVLRSRRPCDAGHHEGIIGASPTPSPMRKFVILIAFAVSALPAQSTGCDTTRSPWTFLRNCVSGALPYGDTV